MKKLNPSNQQCNLLNNDIAKFGEEAGPKEIYSY